jgi:hypothetical protein
MKTKKYSGGVVVNKLNILLVTGIVTDEHDPNMIAMLRFLLESTGRFSVKITESFKGANSESLEDYDLIFIDYDGKPSVSEPFVGWGANAEKALYEFVRNGGGAVVYHSSFIHCDDRAFPDEYDRLTGCCLDIYGDGRKSPKVCGPVKFVPGAHKIIEGFPPDFVVQSEDFFFNPKWFSDIPVTVLATVRDELSDYTDPSRIQPHMIEYYASKGLDSLPGIDTDQPVAWVHNYGKGRVFTVTIGHGQDTMRCPAFTALLVRGTEWAASGEITIPYPDLEGKNRTRCWPYYLDMSVVEFGRYRAF